MYYVQKHISYIRTSSAGYSCIDWIQWLFHWFIYQSLTIYSDLFISYSKVLILMSPPLPLMCPSWYWSNYSPKCILDTTLCDKVCHWLATGRWFPVSSTNKTNHHYITEILLKVALNTITLTLSQDKFSVNNFFLLYMKTKKPEI